MDISSPSISPETLRTLVGTCQAPVIVDVRKPEAFASDPRLITGGVRRTHDRIDAWSVELPNNRSVVAYCVHGHQVSQSVAHELRARGVDAVYLEGGVSAWLAIGGPTVRGDVLASLAAGPSSRWVTRARPKIDRVACPWLVRRFVDPLARFDYVAADEVAAHARAEQAIPYDVPGVRFAHRGECCTFDALLEDFDLLDPALDGLARIVRGADTARLDLAPQSAGLLAVSLGLSVLYADDHEMLEHGMGVYDALYAWLRRARAEGHDAKLFER
jgi:rhodanese-related sulfurtransferase